MAKSNRQSKTKRRRHAAERLGLDGHDPHTDDRLLRAMVHPLRRQVLRLLRASTASMSPTGIEEELALSGLPGESLCKLSYHVRALAAYRVIRHAGRRRARGATEHFYAPCVEQLPCLGEMLSRTRESDEEWLRSWRGRQGGREPASEKADRTARRE
jgi:hypothetical protein